MPLDFLHSRYLAFVPSAWQSALDPLLAGAIGTAMLLAAAMILSWALARLGRPAAC